MYIREFLYVLSYRNYICMKLFYLYRFSINIRLLVSIVMCKKY